MLKKSLYLDDERIPTETIPGYEPWVVVKNYHEFVHYTEHNGLPDFITFDHDLADEHISDFTLQTSINGCCLPDYESYQEKTGLDCARWLVKYCEENALPLPSCAVHSFNPVGANNIQSFINGYNRHTDQPETCFLWKPKFKNRNED